MSRVRDGDIESEGLGARAQLSYLLLERSALAARLVQLLLLGLVSGAGRRLELFEPLSQDVKLDPLPDDRLDELAGESLGVHLLRANRRRASGHEIQQPGLGEVLGTHDA